MKRLLFLLLACSSSSLSYAQGCCSGGSGSPISGGAASGVLLKNQIEVASNYQLIQSDKFYKGSIDTTALFNNFRTDYTYFRLDYGVTKDLTMSVASGYFLNKSYHKLEDEKEIASSGIGDLIIFPRYNLYNKKQDNYRTEISVGLGIKLPLGEHNDSIKNVIELPEELGIPDIINYTPAAPLLQRSSGAKDLLLYSFWYRGYHKRAFRVFVSTLYLKKGFNDLGQKFGNYASIGFFTSKTLWRNVDLTTQIKGELIKGMQAEERVDLLADYNIDQKSTGSKKIFFIPQISYSKKALTVYATSEMPLYQYLNGTQVGSQLQLTLGLNYRFLLQ